VTSSGLRFGPFSGTGPFWVIPINAAVEVDAAVIALATGGTSTI
jgi:hypothetical protein